MVDRKYDDERMLDYAKRAAPFGNVPRYVPPGSNRLPEEVPKNLKPSFNKGGMVKAGSPRVTAPCKDSKTLKCY